MLQGYGVAGLQGCSALREAFFSNGSAAHPWVVEARTGRRPFRYKGIRKLCSKKFTGRCVRQSQLCSRRSAALLKVSLCNISARIGMPAEVKKEIELEIAHVLFLDIVGYSKLSVNEQHARVEELNQVVRFSGQFRKAEAAGRLLKIPTGDGMALVFYKSPEEPAQCAVEISRALKGNARLQVRMGIHSGPISGVVDVNERTNVAGAGINMAQRVMDCGDAGHILLSHHVAEDLAEYERWRPFLHDIGAFDVKHGVRVSVTNLYSDEVGNPQLPSKLAAVKKHSAHRWAEIAVALLVLGAIVGGTFFFLRRPMRSVSGIVDKSIAVLPFENLSSEKENAYFADGIQNEILTDLAKIADLKVISRTSVTPYRATETRKLGEIAQQLGVAHLVEGSVQRVGNRVRVNAQLIDARNDAHLWAQTYERDLADVFAILTEIAKTIADQLQAKLSPREEHAIQRSPTSDIGAFDLYARAKNILLRTGSIPKADTLQAVDLLTQAVARDPSFFDAYCQLAFAHDALYFFGVDHTSARLALAEAALQAASRLRPDAGETHLARGQNLYWGYLDYDGALAELEVARQTLRNDPRIFDLTGLIQRRQGRWEESTRNLERSVELNPRDIGTMGLGVASNYLLLRRYAEAKPWLARSLAFEPNDAFTKVWLAYVDFAWKADTRPLHQTIDSIRATNPAAVPSIAEFWLVCALGERDVAAAKDALIALGEEPMTFAVENVPFNRPFAEGVIARMTEDDEKARSAFTAARAEQEKIVQAQPNYGPALCVLGLIDAGLGRKEEALREGRRAVELLPVEKDSMNGTNMVKYLAAIAAWVGDKDLACEQLASIIRRPSNLSYGQLKLLPFWDPLRGDPRFEKLAEESKQPVALQSSTSSAPDKSIAVLPFENLSRDPDNAFFADGVQDEIVTDLARVADLKVISRISVMPYKSGMPRNVRQIGQQLDVAHVVEGSVQRTGNRVRVNAQLVDARTDRHLWAQTYDRDLADVFAIQSEIAKTIADQLQAKLSPREKNAIELPPTNDISAFDLYTRAKNILLRIGSIPKADTLQAVDLLTQAVARDPSFFDAYCQLAFAHDALYFFGVDHTSARLALAEAALQAASRLRPDAGETHLARGQNLYWGYLDYDGALAELEVARQTLRNDPRIFDLTGLIQRRQGRWEESTRNLERSVELNPRDIGTMGLGVASNYWFCRRYAEAKPWLARALAFEPNDAFTKVWLAYVDFAWKADTRPLHQTIDSIRATNPAAVPSIADFWLVCALAERDAAAAKDALIALGEEPMPFAVENVRFNRPFAEGVIARMTEDDEKARSAFTAARAEQEKIVQAQPNYGPALCVLGLIDAGLGRKEEALREGRRAVELLPVEKDSMNGTNMVRYLAII